MGSRYDNLNAAIAATFNDSKKNKPYRIIEIGVHHAVRAASMVKYAKKLGRTNIEYYGFDLFEDITPEVNANEFGKPALAIGREEARKRILAAGAAKVQLVKGDTKITLPQAVKQIPIANVVFIDGGHTVETISHDLQNILNCCNEKTHILLDDCYPSIYDKGCAFLSKCSSILQEYGIKLEELSPTDTFEGNPYGEGPLSIRFMYARCAAQLTPARLEGMAEKLISEALPSSPEPQEFFPDKSFVEAVSNLVIEKSESFEVKACSKGASEAAGDSFQGAPAFNSCSDSDVQPVRLCKNSCGDLPEEHCKKSGDTCGRRKSSVESSSVENVPQGQTDPVQVPEERQEPNQVVEQGDTAGLGAPCSNNSGSELRPEVSPDVEQGGLRGSRRRRRRGGSTDERSGSQD